MMREAAADAVRRLWRAGDAQGARRLLEGIKPAADAMLSISAKTIRHTVATELRGRCPDQRWNVEGFLGHRWGITERYAKNRPEHLRGVIRAVEAYWTDLGGLLAGEHLSPIVNQERANSVLPGHAPKGVKPLGYLVEPSGIEPLTSTMPL
jgi:hypothetical protein